MSKLFFKAIVPGVLGPLKALARLIKRQALATVITSIFIIVSLGGLVAAYAKQPVVTEPNYTAKQQAISVAKTITSEYNPEKSTSQPGEPSGQSEQGKLSGQSVAADQQAMANIRDKLKSSYKSIPQAPAFDFTLSTMAVTMRLGDRGPDIAAQTTGGEKVRWSVAGVPISSPTPEQFPLLGVPSSSFTFRLVLSDMVPVGTHQITVNATSVNDSSSVRSFIAKKQITLIVLPRPIFEVVWGGQDSYSLTTSGGSIEFPFEVIRKNGHNRILYVEAYTTSKDGIPTSGPFGAHTIVASLDVGHQIVSLSSASSGGVSSGVYDVELRVYDDTARRYNKTITIHVVE